MSILNHIPEIVAWGFGIFLAIVMVRRCGLKAEKLMLAGCILMLITAVVSMVLSNISPWIREQSISAQEIGIIRTVAVGLPSIAGLVCLIRAFWLRFRRERPEAV